MDTQRMNYEEYEKDWWKRNKGSRLRPPRISSWGLIGGILVWAIIAIGAALVSGAHSVPAILHTIPLEVVSPIREGLSLFGFTIFELLIFAGAVYRRDNRYAVMALIISMVGALAANVGSSVLAVSQNKGGGLDLLVAIILSIIAPLAAFLAGEMVHRLFESHRAKMDEALEAYDLKRQDIDKRINRDFAKYEKGFTEYSVNSVNERAKPADRSVNSMNSANGYNKQMNSRQIISEFFERHPEFKNMTLDQLNAAIEQESGVKVGRTSIHNVRKDWVPPGSETLQ
jgi:hypothetical protein